MFPTPFQKKGGKRKAANRCRGKETTMRKGDVVKLEVPNEEPVYGHITRVVDEGKHVCVCRHDEEEAKAQFELLTRELVPA